MLSINLDDETERYLVEILKEEKITVSELMRQVLRDRLGNHRPQQTVLERMGGIPKEVLSASELPENLSDRDIRKALIAEHIQARHVARHE